MVGWGRARTSDFDSLASDSFVSHMGQPWSSHGPRRGCPVLSTRQVRHRRIARVSRVVVLDYNGSNEVVGVEVLHMSGRSPDLNPPPLNVETP